MLFRFVIVALVFACGAPANAVVGIHATCANGQASVQVCMLNNYDPQYVGIAITRYQLGSCSEPEVVTDQYIPLPAPLPPSLDNVECVTVSVPAPLQNVTYRFDAVLVDLNGGMTPLLPEFIPMHTFQPQSFASDGDAVTMRGTLTLLPNKSDIYMHVFITPCADGCWGDPARHYQVAEVPWPDPIWDLFGSPVDIYGTRVRYLGMPLPFGEFYITDLRPAPPGVCGAVSSEVRSWGTLKSTFR